MSVIDDFHKHYVYQYQNVYWLGTKILKCPLDMWLYQEIIHDLRPDHIIETGTFMGASALYLSQMCELVGNGQVTTIDTEHHEKRPTHPRLTYVLGSSTEPAVVNMMKDKVRGAKCVMVILDSDHSKDHVLNEMMAYGPLVTRHSYMIVEDTNINGHPVLPDFGPGPYEAVQEFMSKTTDFVEDVSKHKFLMTLNKHGYLKKI